MNDLVTVIMPIYNSEEYLEQSVNSVLAQTYSQLELILIDDASTDDSYTTAEKLADADPRVQAIRMPVNGGQGPARNVGLAKASGRYVAFLDADDWWDINKLQTQLLFMRKRNAAMSHTSYRFVDESGTELREPLALSKRPVTYHDILTRTEIGCSTVVIDVDKVGHFRMLPYRRCQDLQLWFTLLKRVSSHPLRLPLTNYRIHTNSTTSNKFSKIKPFWTILRTNERMNFPTAAFYTFVYVANGAIRFTFPSLDKLRANN